MFKFKIWGLHFFFPVFHVQRQVNEDIWLSMSDFLKFNSPLNAMTQGQHHIWIAAMHYGGNNSSEVSGLCLTVHFIEFISSIISNSQSRIFNQTRLQSSELGLFGMDLVCKVTIAARLAGHLPTCGRQWVIAFVIVFDAELLERLQKKAMKIIRGLEQLSYEGEKRL